MADNSLIEWCDATLNYINGCSVLSPGCTNCYAMKQAHRFPVRQGLTTKTKGGMVWTGEVHENPKALAQALAWKRGRRIFWNAHGDLFHENVPDEWIDRLFAVCALTPQHTHMILTKRSARMREYLRARKAAKPIMVCIGDGTLAQHPFNNELRPPPNVWLGVSVEDQQRADERIPDLLATPAAVRFISAEPLLGPVDLSSLIFVEKECSNWEMDGSTPPADPETGLQECCSSCDWTGVVSEPAIDWIIVGGESGPNARPMHPDWARSLRDQCAAAGVAFHFKQWGEWAPVCAIDLDALDAELYHEPRFFEGHRRCKVEQCVLQASGRRFEQDRSSRVYGEDPANGDFAFLSGTGAMSMMKIGKKRAGRLLDGVEHNGMPSA